MKIFEDYFLKVIVLFDFAGTGIGQRTEQIGLVSFCFCFGFWADGSLFFFVKLFLA